MQGLKSTGPASADLHRTGPALCDLINYSLWRLQKEKPQGAAYALLGLVV